jgi:hypothetical protein
MVHGDLRHRPVRAYDMVQQPAIVDCDVMDLFGFDTLEMGRGFLPDDSDWKPWVLPGGTECEIPGYLNVENKDGDWLIHDDSGYELGILKKGSLYFEQTRSPLMETGIESDDFGDRITFWGGGCDTQRILPNASPAEIKKNVREMIAIFRRDGGFVFQQVHNILANVPPENITMLEAVNSQG